MHRFLAFIFVVALVFAACGEDSPPPSNETAGEEPEGFAGEDDDCEEGKRITTDTGLEYVDIKCGEGDEAVDGSQLTVHYVGTLESGKIFDSSRKRGEPFQFLLGAGQVIAGWDEGFAGMRVGGVRELTIPPDLAYGAAGAPPSIPPDATLMFEVELLDVREATG
jgi:FKBP-type peptidyl-prolyl cis-trans isomerase